ncbi:hypothetical protein AwDysgo_13430 [Bacteroidales bacterium]|nr:hypothetical protein AwDysgo_13430 [Bacteroidales bacterium]
MPKDTVYIYTDNLKYLYLHNSVLEMNKTLSIDSLTVVMECASGKLNVDAEYLNISAAAGSKLSATGSSSFVKYAVGAGSEVDARKLKAKHAQVHVMGHSSLEINAEKVTEELLEKSKFKNFYKK